MKHPVHLFLLGSLLLVACTPDDSAARAKLFEEQRAALEKARTVEKTVLKQAQDQQQNIDKQSGEYPPQ